MCVHFVLLFHRELQIYTTIHVHCVNAHSVHVNASTRTCWVALHINIHMYVRVHVMPVDIIVCLAGPHCVCRVVISMYMYVCNFLL